MNDRASLKQRMAAKDTEALLAIWKANDCNEWQPEVFDVVKELLEERGVPIPSQKPRPPSPAETDKSAQRPLLLSVLTILGIMGTLAMVAISATSLSSGSSSPLPFFLVLLNIGLLFIFGALRQGRHWAWVTIQIVWAINAGLSVIASINLQSGLPLAPNIILVLLWFYIYSPAVISFCSEGKESPQVNATRPTAEELAKEFIEDILPRVAFEAMEKGTRPRLLEESINLAGVTLRRKYNLSAAETLRVVEIAAKRLFPSVFSV